MIYINSPRARACLRVALPAVAIPATVLFGALFLQDNYTVISLLMATLTLLLFFAGIEKKKLSARRLTLTAVITALSVAGRFIPIFKPVTAFAVTAGICLGGEVGFTVGAMSALISNVWFGQGPWTPFQMLAWGAIGYAAGLLDRPLRKFPLLLYLYGAVSGVLYSLIMDVWSVLWYHGTFDISLYAASVLTSLPYMISYAVSNVVFLIVLFRPFRQKLDRIKLKYGI